MLGRTCEQRRKRQHMRPIPLRATVAAVSASVSPNFFLKDGRKIHVGDCALFQSPRGSMPFVGIICKIIESKEGLRLSVNWLYRPSDVQPLKGSTAVFAPNEIYYSFHKDEISASSLLHPCKVAFLRKGIELPSGTCSHVCRRVYDIENKCLWWLTDRDYVNERKEEVNRLLDKTQREMNGALDSGGCSPKVLNSSADSQPVSYKGKKRERGDQGSGVTKRECLSESDVLVSNSCKQDNILKYEIAKITEKGGLVSVDSVEKLVQLMQPNNTKRNIDLAGKSVIVDVIALTDKCECLGRFMQLRGLPVLDRWLQEVHRAKIGDHSGSTDTEKSIEWFILAVLHALDNLPVNLDALKSCNVGKSVNYLRSHKNSEIQKKAKRLVDKWKKRVQVEMNMLDAKSSLSGVSLPSSETSHELGKYGVGPSEIPTKASPVASPASTKSLASLASSMASNSKDSNSKTNISSGNNDILMKAIKEEWSSSSSQSMSNSRSCSSEHIRTVISCREDARSSTTGSGSAGKVCGSKPCNQNSKAHVCGLISLNIDSGCRKSGLSKNFSGNELPDVTTYEKDIELPIDHENHKHLIVRSSNAMGSPPTILNGDPRGSLRGHSHPNGERNQLIEPEREVKVDIGKHCIGSYHGKDEQAGTTATISQISSEAVKSHANSFRSMKALTENCDKFCGSQTPGDDTGMNLLASAVTGELSKSDPGLQLGSTRMASERTKSDAESEESSEKVAQNARKSAVIPPDNGDDVSSSIKNNGNHSTPAASAGDISACSQGGVTDSDNCSGIQVLSNGDHNVQCMASVSLSPTEGGTKRSSIPNHPKDIYKNSGCIVSLFETEKVSYDDHKEVSEMVPIDPGSAMKVKEESHSVMLVGLEEECMNSAIESDIKAQNVVEIGNPSSEEIDRKQRANWDLPVVDECDEYAEEASCCENVLNRTDKQNVTANLNFDLNERLATEVGLMEEPKEKHNATLARQLPLGASITVVAAAKGAFLPPENPLRCGEGFGWKGSAATSAFRPAEPTGSVDRKQNRLLPLDIDLNEPDRTLEEAQSQNNKHESGFCDRVFGGLDLDLNRSGQRSDLGFDLNVRPCLDDVSTDPAKGGYPFLPIPGVGVNNSPAFWSLPTWVSRRSSYAENMTPNYSMGFSMADSQTAGSTLLGRDVCRPQVLSPSPTVAFPMQYPASFQFETLSPPASSASSGSVCCFPGIPSQMMGSASLVTCRFPRPFFMSLPGGTHAVDSPSNLNGPGSVDAEKKDDVMFLASRQHSNAGNVGWNV